MRSLGALSVPQPGGPVRLLSAHRPIVILRIMCDKDMTRIRICIPAKTLISAT